MANETLIGGAVGVIRVFGVPIRFHFTFVLLLIFLLFIGASGKQSSAAMALYILALFGSVLLHELGHAVVAHRYGIKTIEIVMFPIGGLARLDRMPKAKEELWIALAGPAVNLVIASLLIGWLSFQNGLMPITGLANPTDGNLAHRIAAGNLLLAAFNMLPAFPMDGGRVLRGLLALRKTEEDATRIAAASGQVLAVLMGLFGLLSANFMLVFVAMFVYLGAAQEGAVARGRSLTMGFPVRAAMITDFRTLQHGETIRDAGNLLLATSQQDFPVMHGTEVIGLLKRHTLMRAMMTDGPEAYVSSAMERDFVRLSPDADLSEALPSLNAGCALVMDNASLAGMVTPENISEFLLLRQIGLMKAKQQSR